jgi:formaldehyde-activating enzyme
LRAVAFADIASERADAPAEDARGIADTTNISAWM